MPPIERRELRRLAQLYNVQPFHYDGFGRRTEPPVEALLRLLRELGASVERIEDIGGALRERRQHLWRRGIAPVVVAWDGGPAAVTLRVPSSQAGEAIHYSIRLEEGGSLEGTLERPSRAKVKTADVEGVPYVAMRASLPPGLPAGYHRLSLQLREWQFDLLVISAPLHASTPPEAESKNWGIFLPLHALHTERSWGAGDFSDLEVLGDWIRGLGGRVLGTLPLLASFLAHAFDPSPYSPVSRRAWNEFYVDVTNVPEFERCPSVRKIFQSAEFQNELKALRGLRLVDYRRQMSLKRQALAAMAGCLTGSGGKRLHDLRDFAFSHPHIEEYARFRAAMERQQRPWRDWPAENRHRLQEGDYDEEVKEYYLYAQWVAQEQIRRTARKLRARGGFLYLDFPLGVHRDGYDTWRERGLFALGTSGGAPPDSFFTKGQNWGFPPLHPERLREGGYRYLIASLRHHLQCAGMLRIDHVMGLHRLFWIPQGSGASEGAYVHYPAEELYAVLCLEAARHQAIVVGENLGTVPSYVDRALARHGIRGMYVGQFNVDCDPQRALRKPPAGSVASLNTHDTPTFASFWAGADIQDRLELGLLDEAGAARELQNRCAQKESLVAFLKSRGLLTDEVPDADIVLTAWLRHLANGPSGLLLVNLEDLWLEMLPQNVPGTWEERPNWRRKAGLACEEFSRNESVVNRLRIIDDERKRSG